MYSSISLAPDPLLWDMTLLLLNLPLKGASVHMPGGVSFVYQVAYATLRELRLVTKWSCLYSPSFRHHSFSETKGIKRAGASNSPEPRHFSFLVSYTLS